MSTSRALIDANSAQSAQTSTTSATIIADIVDKMVHISTTRARIVDKPSAIVDIGDELADN
jgi:hypothetical protein